MPAIIDKNLISEYIASGRSTKEIRRRRIAESRLARVNTRLIGIRWSIGQREVTAAVTTILFRLSLILSAVRFERRFVDRLGCPKRRRKSSPGKRTQGNVYRVPLAT